MRLERFYVERYRLLNKLDLSFTRDDQPKGLQEKYLLDFLAGVNGTGKSTVLHLLGQLFAALDAGATSFIAPIDLEYVLTHDDKTDDGKSTRVRVSSLTDGANQEEEESPSSSTGYPLRFTITEQDDGVERTHQPPSGGQRLEKKHLPGNIVMYSSGEESAWLAELAAIRTSPADTDRSSGTSSTREDGDGEPRPEERILYLQTDRMPAVTLCGLLASQQSKWQDERKDENDEVLRDVLDSLRIARLAGFSLRCRVHEGLIERSQRDIIDNLKRCADRVVRQGADYLLLFNLRSDETLPSGGKNTVKHKIHELYDSRLQLFQNLNMLYEHEPYQDRPLQEVNLFFEPVGPSDGEQPMLHLWGWFSDGERSFLSRMALFALFRTPGILILLDEPEVHFNDFWKREIVYTLHKIMREQRSHALITTHSAITLTDVPRQNILVMRREGGATHRTAGQAPGIETLAADPSDIIVHVFGTPFPNGARSVQYIRNRIAGSTPQELEILSKQVAPGYWRYRIQLEIAQARRRPQ